VLQIKPDFSIGDYLSNLPYRNDQDRERHLDLLQAASLPV